MYHYLVHISWVKIQTISNPNRQYYFTNDLTLDLKEAFPSIKCGSESSKHDANLQLASPINWGNFSFSHRVINIFKQYFSKTKYYSSEMDHNTGGGHIVQFARCGGPILFLLYVQTKQESLQQSQMIIFKTKSSFKNIKRPLIMGLYCSCYIRCLPRKLPIVLHYYTYVLFSHTDD